MFAYLQADITKPQHIFIVLLSKGICSWKLSWNFQQPGSVRLTLGTTGSILTNVPAQMWCCLEVIPLPPHVGLHDCPPHHKVQCRHVHCQNTFYDYCKAVNIGRMFVLPALKPNWLSEHYILHLKGEGANALRPSIIRVKPLLGLCCICDCGRYTHL